MGSLLTINDKNLHEITVAGNPYIFHIPSSGLFRRDAIVGDIFALLRQSRWHSEESITYELSSKYPVTDIAPAISELKTLALISDEAIPHETDKKLALDNFPLTTVVLNVNTGCNLSCSYCYKEDLDTPAQGKKMTFATAKQAIAMLLKESPDQPRYNIVFFGGEPLSNLTLIKQVISYAEQLFGDRGKSVDFSLTTNATLLTESLIDYLDEHNVGIAVSIDGPKAYHDRNRITVGGKGTYETVAKKVALLLSRYCSRPVGARVTLTRGITDIDTIWDHLFNTLGFSEVGFAPVTSGDIASYNLTDSELIDVFGNMKKLGQKYLQAALNNQSIGFSNLHQLITDLHEGSKKALPCGAGVGMVAVDHSGGINLCHRFTGSSLPLFGDVTRGLEKNALNDFLNQRLAIKNAEQQTGCASCRIRNLCGGGCYHESYARFGDPVTPTYHYCDLMRDWVDFGIGVYTQIMQHNPGFISTYITPRKAQS